MKHIITLFLSMLVIACGSKKRTDEQAFLDSLDNMTLEAPRISDEVIMDIIQQIPSPLEISTLLKDAGTKYDVNILTVGKRFLIRVGNVRSCGQCRHY